MTTLASLIADVYALTNRPDLVSETALAVRAATLKMHQSDYYFKDVYETGIVFSTADYIQSLDYKALITNWRSFKYLRKVDATTLTPGDFIDLITPEEVLDSYKVTKDDVCYMAGSQLQIRSSTQGANFLIGCYVHPNITTSGYSSWVADEFPFAVVFEAAAIIFKAIGFDEQVSVFRGMVQEQIELIKMSNIIANGY